MYKRILLKLSGEQLQGDQTSGFSTERVQWVAQQVKRTLEADIEVVIMVGGGNYARGAHLANDAILRVTADNVGMLATTINALLLGDVFNHAGVPTRALGNIKADQVIDQFTHRRAMSHLSKRRVVVVAGGVGRPFLTTDTAALNLALELECDVVIKTTKVDGVYDKDPLRFADAVKFETLSYQQALQNPDIAVMDKAAIGLAMEQRKPVIICALLEDGNIVRAARGERVGTRVG